MPTKDSNHTYDNESPGVRNLSLLVFASGLINHFKPNVCLPLSHSFHRFSALTVNILQCRAF
jgi:hypothetical protein